VETTSTILSTYVASLPSSRIIAATFEIRVQSVFFPIEFNSSRLHRDSKELIHNQQYIEVPMGMVFRDLS
jgi:hypothetical protein